MLDCVTSSQTDNSVHLKTFVFGVSVPLVSAVQSQYPEGGFMKNRLCHQQHRLCLSPFKCAVQRPFVLAPDSLKELCNQTHKIKAVLVQSDHNEHNDVFFWQGRGRNGCKAHI